MRPEDKEANGMIRLIFGLMAFVLLCFPSPSESIVVEYSPDANTVLLDHFNGSTAGNYVAGTLGYTTSIPDLHEAANFTTGTWVRYNLPGWYQWSYNFDPQGKQGSVEMWVNPKNYNIGLLNFQWCFTTSPPSAGYILGLGITADGKLSSGVWSSIGVAKGDSGLLGNATIPLNQWTHIAYSWEPGGTSLYVNNQIDAFEPYDYYPALNSTFYVYANNWGGSDIGYIDELRIQRTPYSPAPVPEPATMVLFGSGLAGLGYLQKRMRKQRG